MPLAAAADTVHVTVQSDACGPSPWSHPIVSLHTRTPPAPPRLSFSSATASSKWCNLPAIHPSSSRRASISASWARSWGGDRTNDVVAYTHCNIYSLDHKTRVEIFVHNPRSIELLIDVRPRTACRAVREHAQSIVPRGVNGCPASRASCVCHVDAGWLHCAMWSHNAFAPRPHFKLSTRLRLAVDAHPRCLPQAMSKYINFDQLSEYVKTLFSLTRPGRESTAD